MNWYNLSDNDKRSHVVTYEALLLLQPSPAEADAISLLRNHVVNLDCAALLDHLNLSYNVLVLVAA